MNPVTTSFLSVVFAYLLTRFVLRFFFGHDIKIEMVKLKEESEGPKVVKPDPKDLDDDQDLSL